VIPVASIREGLEIFAGELEAAPATPQCQSPDTALAHLFAIRTAQCRAAFAEDLRGIDARIRETRKKLAVAVQAAGTSLTGLYGVGPVVAAVVIGDVRDVSRFPGRDHFVAYNGTAPIEVASGPSKIYRLSRRGNRRLNHAIHMAAVTQIGHRHSEGRAYYDKKLAEGKTPKQALRSLKRQVSNAIFGLPPG
jgi:transposase